MSLLRPGQNEGTALVENPLLQKKVVAETIDAHRLFVERYDTIRRAQECHRDLGALIFAFDDEESAIGHVWLRASLDKTRATIVGRHSMCGLTLPTEYKEVSLRHLVVLVRAISHTEIRVRVIDLHTGTAFCDEEGRVLQAVSTEGPMFISVGRVKLAILLTESESFIPESGEDAFACIPDRVFLEERPGTAGRVDRRVDAHAERLAPGATIVRSKLGPLAAAGDLCKSDETPKGLMVVRAGGGPVRRPVGSTALERGILIGRYARCDVGSTSDEDSRLSRVHLLVIEDQGEVVALDTASTNGSFVGGKSFLLERLTDGAVFDLAGELEMTWHDP